MAERISSAQYDSIKSFLLGKGFKKDPYNMADGMVSGLKGYKKDQTVCIIFGGATGYKETEGQWIPPGSDIKDVTVICGELEQSTQ